MELESEEYDAAISVGTLTIGHPPKESLLQLSKVIQPYGYIVFTLRSDILDESEYGDYLRNMVKSKLWNEEEVSGENRKRSTGSGFARNYLSQNRS